MKSNSSFHFRGSCFFGSVRSFGRTSISSLLIRFLAWFFLKNVIFSGACFLMSRAHFLLLNERHIHWEFCPTYSDLSMLSLATYSKSLPTQLCVYVVYINIYVYIYIYIVCICCIIILPDKESELWMSSLLKYHKPMDMTIFWGKKIAVCSNL